MTTIGPWYENLRKPSWNSPNWVFGPAWTVILGLAAWSGVLAWTNASTGTEQLRVILLFGINMIFHMLWSPLFFNLRRPDWALVEIPFLWLSIVALIFGLAPFSPASAWAPASIRPLGDICRLPQSNHCANERSVSRAVNAKSLQALDRSVFSSALTRAPFESSWMRGQVSCSFHKLGFFINLLDFLCGHTESRQLCRTEGG